MLARNAAPVQRDLDLLVGHLYESPLPDIHSLLSEFSPLECGELAIFCYGRAHLRDIGLAIAATCDLDSLVAPGGKAAGISLFELSREVPQVVEQLFPGNRRAKITLARCTQAAF